MQTSIPEMCCRYCWKKKISPEIYSLFVYLSVNVLKFSKLMVSCSIEIHHFWDPSFLRSCRISFCMYVSLNYMYIYRELVTMLDFFIGRRRYISRPGSTDLPYSTYSNHDYSGKFKSSSICMSMCLISLHR